MRLRLRSPHLCEMSRTMREWREKEESDQAAKLKVDCVQRRGCGGGQECYQHMSPLMSYLFSISFSSPLSCATLIITWTLREPMLFTFSPQRKWFTCLHTQYTLCTSGIKRKTKSVSLFILPINMRHSIEWTFNVSLNIHDLSSKVCKYSPSVVSVSYKHRKETKMFLFTTQIAS